MASARLGLVSSVAVRLEGVAVQVEDISGKLALTAGGRGKGVGTAVAI